MNKPLFAALLFLLAATDASAWSREGHELVAELAERRLSPPARAEVARLLAAEPDPTLRGVATWADDMRAAGRADGLALGKLSERWHYVNFPSGADCAFVPARIASPRSGRARNLRLTSFRPAPEEVTR